MRWQWEKISGYMWQLRGIRKRKVRHPLSSHKHKHTHRPTQSLSFTYLLHIHTHTNHTHTHSIRQRVPFWVKNRMWCWHGGLGWSCIFFPPFHSCTECNGDGLQQCETCEGRKQLLMFINLKITWWVSHYQVCALVLGTFTILYQIPKL